MRDEDERMRQLDELIASGWAEIPQWRIPDNWRDIPRAEIPRLYPGPQMHMPDPILRRRKVRRPVDERLSRKELWMRRRLKSQ